MGMNGLKVKNKLAREVAAETAVVGCEAPVLNSKTANKRQVEGVGADNM